MDNKKHSHIAVFIMLVFTLPILLIYGNFFRMAFLDNDGNATLSNFRFLYETITLKKTVVFPIGPAFINTLLFTIICTIVEVVVSCLAGYGISRFTFKGKNFISVSILVLRLFPGILLLIGELYVLLSLNILNRFIGVIVVAVSLRLPGSTYIIKNFFDSISRDVENASLVDGCSRLSSFFQVIIHLVKPGIASISTFSFLSAWSNYILFNALIFNAKTPVLATYIRKLSSSDNMIADYGVFSAMGLVYMLPVLVFFVVVQKQLMQANIQGGKGL